MEAKMVSNSVKAARVDRPRLLAAAAVGAALIGVSAAPVSAANVLANGYVYTTVNIPSLAGAYNSTLVGINDQGELIGYSASNAAESGFVWSHGTVTWLNDPAAGPGGFTSVNAINNAGDVVGQACNASVSSCFGFVYSHGRYTTIIDPLVIPNDPLTAYNNATGINDAGEVVGTYDGPSGEEAFIEKNGVYTTLDSRLTDDVGAPTSINDSGEILANFDVLDNHGKFSYLSDPLAMPPGPPFPTYTDGYAINNPGEVAGSYIDTSFNNNGFVESDGIYTTVDDPLDTTENTLIYGINDRGQVVGDFGYCCNYTGFIATPVSDSGAAVAFALRGISGAPEPATWAMLILGLGLIGFAARRRSAGFAAAG
jgi:hypothetical protein